MAGVVTWTCALCKRTTTGKAIHDVKVMVEEPWVSRKVTGQHERSLIVGAANASKILHQEFFGAANASKILHQEFCSNEHKIAYDEASRKSRGLAKAAADATEYEVFTEEMRKSCLAAMSAVDALATVETEKKND